MKLEVGMYVRTLNGIVKIDKIQNDVMKDTKGYLHYGDFIRVSNNIIDLIEVGDYVNGYKVIEVGVEELGHTYLSLDMNNDIHWLESEIEQDKDIQSIVTKEQFESMGYKVGE